MYAYDFVAREMKNAIADGEFKVGERIPSTRQLEPRFGCTKSTIIAGLRIVANEGFLEARPNSRFIVKAVPKGEALPLADRVRQVERTLDYIIKRLETHGL